MRSAWRSSRRCSSASTAPRPMTRSSEPRARRAEHHRGALSPRFVGGKVLGALGTFAFVVVFNFFLFRVVESNPVATLFRGRNLTEAQREQLKHQFGLDGSRLDQF